ncbi:hypothetical protein [Kribbella sp. NPDC049584]|uniref:hypothetical protein n=1 Tax=Kribbella sp. NPDC049584 TaxID=3154833 RepID=UPI00343FA7F4
MYLTVAGRTIMNWVQFTSGDSKDLPDIAITQEAILTMMEHDFPDPDDNLDARRINGPGNYEFIDDGALHT